MLLLRVDSLVIYSDVVIIHDQAVLDGGTAARSAIHIDTIPSLFAISWRLRVPVQFTKPQGSCTIVEVPPFWTIVLPVTLWCHIVKIHYPGPNLVFPDNIVS
jgi:hypothetical protein